MSSGWIRIKTGKLLSKMRSKKRKKVIYRSNSYESNEINNYERCHVKKTMI